MHTSLRTSLRRLVWFVLGCCALIDGALGEAAISGAGDVFYVDEAGRWVLPYAQPELWAPIVGFVLFQALLILSIIRLRNPQSPPPSLRHPTSPVD